MKAASIAINAAIFLTTLVLVTTYFRKDGRWRLKHGLKAFRYFTVLSNAFCAASALAMALAQIGGDVPGAVLTFKYLGTVCVAVTLLTVLLFLGPTQGYGPMLKGDNLYMHLIGPLLAIVSFRWLEKGRMAFSTALLGVIPVALYGVVYLYRIILAPEGRRWEDFYGFNRGGRWPVAFAAMLAGTLLVCAALCLP